MLFLDPTIVTRRSRPLSPKELGDLDDRQSKIPGFSLTSAAKSHVAIVGAGGIGSQVAWMLARKGYGRLTLMDPDAVETSNLSRQMFDRRDRGKNKAAQLAKALASTAMFPLEITAYPHYFQEVKAIPGALDGVDLIICAPDNNPTRRAVAAYGIARRMPVILGAVSRTGGQCYVMVQEPDQACWSCAFPEYRNDERYPCNVGGIVDILGVLAGSIAYATDTLMCSRARHWNVRTTGLDGAVPDRAYVATRKPDCPLCGHRKGDDAHA